MQLEFEDDGPFMATSCGPLHWLYVCMCYYELILPLRWLLQATALSRRASHLMANFLLSVSDETTSV